MHIGYAPIFQNLDNELTDREVYAGELRLAEMAEPMGFDSIWESEHHFTDYEMTPDTLQFLTYMAGRTKKAMLGSLVVILPWHNPLRVAENVSLLDHYSNSRYILGMGRGLGAFEMQGWNVDMSNTREIFNESAEAVVNALRNGYMESDGQFIKQVRRDIRPAPLRSFEGRTYCAGMSPESIPFFAKLGAGVIMFPFKEWSDVRGNLDLYRKAWSQMRPDTEPPKPIVVVFPVVDKDPVRAEEDAMKYVGRHYRAVNKIYNFGGEHFKNIKGYEHYAKNAQDFKELPDAKVKAFVDLMPYGTPKQVLEKMRAIVDLLDLGAMIVHFRFGNNSFEHAEAGMRLFAEEVLPVVHTWNTGPFAQIRERVAVAA
jgi:alkanesulfonate monooxygenase SsuD/methylene tetrahydromethanopterin reductase-like flavin-dependent oxidoreductase (luciferase family)